MPRAVWTREFVRQPIALAATRSWQSLQIIVLLPHVQRVNVVVRQQNAQIMVAARMAHQCLQTMTAPTATHQVHAQTAPQTMIPAVFQSALLQFVMLASASKLLDFLCLVRQIRAQMRNAVMLLGLVMVTQDVILIMWWCPKLHSSFAQLL
jgi:hypothetical protein